ncbi:hypothetical protein Ancab_028767 [Ancistrocladus abbreviatus]
MLIVYLHDLTNSMVSMNVDSEKFQIHLQPHKYCLLLSLPLCTRTDSIYQHYHNGAGDSATFLIAVGNADCRKSCLMKKPCLFLQVTKPKLNFTCNSNRWLEDIAVDKHCYYRKPAQ